jgi:hypothetical protein
MKPFLAQKKRSVFLIKNLAKPVMVREAKINLRQHVKNAKAKDKSFTAKDL